MRFFTILVLKHQYSKYRVALEALLVLNSSQELVVILVRLVKKVFLYLMLLVPCLLTKLFLIILLIIYIRLLSSYEFYVIGSILISGINSVWFNLSFLPKCLVWKVIFSFNQVFSWKFTSLINCWWVLVLLYPWMQKGSFVLGLV